MPRQQLIERRENTVLDHLIDIKAALAENTAETKALTEQIKGLNGKVAGHESRLQSLESDKAVKIREDSLSNTKENRRTIRWENYMDKIIWGIIIIVCMLLYQVLIQTGLITDFLK